MAHATVSPPPDAKALHDARARQDANAPQDAALSGGLAQSNGSAQSKVAALRAALAALPGAVVAYSGGVDSSLLAYLAHQELGDRALAVTADSPSLARSELADARAQAERLGLRHRVVQTQELDDERYTVNRGDRCRFCKEELVSVLSAVAAEAGDWPVLLGVNTDDLGDHRPGQAAARRMGAKFPMVDAGLSKADVRGAAHELGLPTSDKPASACLSSRLAYGVPVTREALRRVEDAEDALRRAGFGGRFRVRDQGGDLARIEVEAADIPRAATHATEIVALLKDAGFRYVTLDLEPYRQGSHNAVLGLPRLRTATP
ncbi:ATP-dependent sacrificial sulfur transferase LarE [Actinomadura decatromicini]|uniref:ATP-dependent sacrificial sulfur transferase LarE n=1 Tax=Actinomadura decatromicini TaxID=2604572 RepID=A0A5D3FG04_9ACTN|nr:ATP-dependent sacrificial sulfur transferase LarE [Actinomadura decatromicini]TYK46760.1 ATP-dependent sacrificial sulfur transferase LarE [Actinomadura decatromicini]